MEMRAPFIDKIAYFLEKRGEVVTDPLIGLTGLVDLSRFSAAPSARLSHPSFKSDGAFPA